jgi:upstream activation factor subunit UAF30
MEGEEEDEEEEDEDEEDEDDSGPARKKRKALKGSALSPEMQEFLGVERMTRPQVLPVRTVGKVRWSNCCQLIARRNHLLGAQVLKHVWEYIKKEGLQDPANRNTILLDDALCKLFDPPVTSFSITKQLSRHILKNQ